MTTVYGYDIGFRKYSVSVSFIFRRRLEEQIDTGVWRTGLRLRLFRQETSLEMDLEDRFLTLTSGVRIPFLYQTFGWIYFRSGVDLYFPSRPRSSWVEKRRSVWRPQSPCTIQVRLWLTTRTLPCGPPFLLQWHSGQVKEVYYNCLSFYDSVLITFNSQRNSVEVLDIGSFYLSSTGIIYETKMSSMFTQKLPFFLLRQRFNKWFLVVILLYLFYIVFYYFKYKYIKYNIICNII